MSLIIGFVIPVILYLITLPLQSSLFLTRQYIKVLEKKEKKKGKGSLKDKLGITRSSNVIREAVGLSPITDNRLKKPNKLKVVGLKATRHFIKVLSWTISLLRSVAIMLCTLVASIISIFLPALLNLIVGVAGIVVFMGEAQSVTYSNVNTNVSSNVSESTNIVDSTTNSSGWVGSIEKLANWYIQNVPTYQNDTGGGGTGSRAWYPCDLLEGNTVGDDCTGFSYACLILAGYISDSPTNAPPSGWYIGEDSTMASKLKEAGFTHGYVASGMEFKAGDILAKSGHVELLVGVNEDGTYQTFGWGTIRHSYPSTESTTGDSLVNQYSDYYRLNE